MSDDVLAAVASVGVGLGLLFLVLFAYLFPWLVALSRGHRNSGPIFLLNLAFGWTVLVWFGCLVWSVASGSDRS